MEFKKKYGQDEIVLSTSYLSFPLSLDIRTETSTALALLFFVSSCFLSLIYNFTPFLNSY